MNIDLASTFEFGNVPALRDFLLVHRFVHDATAKALTAKYQVVASTFGISGESAENEWAALMRSQQRGQPVPAGLQVWLELHAQIHINTYALLGQNPTTAPDLSVVDFSSPEQFYDWLYVHQQMHDFEQSSLGLT